MTYNPITDNGPNTRPGAGTYQVFSPDLFNPADASYSYSNAQNLTNAAATWSHPQVMGASGLGTPLGKAAAGVVRYGCLASRRSALAQLGHEAMTV